MNRIEKEFNQKAKQISIQPSASAWPALHERMNKKNKKKPKFIQMKLYVFAATLIGILLICFVAFLVIKLHGNKNTSSAKPPIQIQVDSNSSAPRDSTGH